MSLLAKNKGGADFEPISVGLHNAVYYAVIDIGTQPQTNPQFGEKNQAIFIWELPLERIEFTKDGVKYNLPRTISAFYTVSLSKKSNLRPMLESWRGRQFSEKELEGFRIDKVAGASCQLNIVHQIKDGQPVAKISAIVPLPKGMKPLKPENPLIKFDLEEFLKSNANDIPVAIPDWIKGKIMQSREWEKDQVGQPEQAASTEQHAIEEDVPF
jgi:hypothetical protein